jgi:hypothetical protein
MREYPQPGQAPGETPATDLPLAPPPNPSTAPNPEDGPQPLPPRTLPGTEEAPVEAPDPGLPAPHFTPGIPV